MTQHKLDTGENKRRENNRNSTVWLLGECFYEGRPPSALSTLYSAALRCSISFKMEHSLSNKLVNIMKRLAPNSSQIIPVSLAGDQSSYICKVARKAAPGECQSFRICTKFTWLMTQVMSHFWIKSFFLLRQSGQEISHKRLRGDVCMRSTLRKNHKEKVSSPLWDIRKQILTLNPPWEYWGENIKSLTAGSAFFGAHTPIVRLSSDLLSTHTKPGIIAMCSGNHSTMFCLMPAPDYRAVNKLMRVSELSVPFHGAGDQRFQLAAARLGLLLLSKHFE